MKINHKIFNASMAALIGIAILFLVAICTDSFAQSKTTAKALKDTVIKSISYKLYQGSKGGRYVLKTAKSSGKVYKMYIKAKK